MARFILQGLWRYKWQLLAVAGIVLFLLYSARNIEVRTTLQSVLAWISTLGFWAPLLFIIAYVLGCIFFLPATILTLGSGIIFGVFLGSILSSIAATLGATASFLIARFLARKWVVRWINRHPKFKAIDEAVAQEGWKIVFLTRLSPIFPFNFLNYSFGISRVRLLDYLWASWVGMLPATVALVFMGWLIGDIALLAGEYRARSNFEWGLYGFGVVATIVFTAYVTRVARNALSQRLESNRGDEAAGGMKDDEGFP